MVAVLRFCAVPEGITIPRAAHYTKPRLASHAGFEPTFVVSKTTVLPLDEREIGTANRSRTCTLDVRSVLHIHCASAVWHIYQGSNLNHNLRGVVHYPLCYRRIGGPSGNRTLSIGVQNRYATVITNSPHSHWLRTIQQALDVTQSPMRRNPGGHPASIMWWGLSVLNRPSRMADGLQPPSRP